MNRADFIHETAIRAAAAMSALRGPIMIGTVEGIGMVLTPREIAERSRDVALALARVFDIDHPEGADALEDEPWRG